MTWVTDIDTREIDSGPGAPGGATPHLTSLTYGFTTHTTDVFVDNIVVEDDDHILIAKLKLLDVGGDHAVDPEWTNEQTVAVLTPTVPIGATDVDIDEDQNFTSPTSVAYVGYEYAYTFDTDVNELKTVYARLRNMAETVIITSDTISLDTIAPNRPETPIDEGEFSLDPNVTFDWPASSDPAPGGGVASYDCQIGTSPGGADIFNDNVGDVLSKTINAPLLQLIYCRVRAIDRAGNASAWSESSDGIFFVDDQTPTLLSLLLVDEDGANDPDSEWTNSQTVAISLTGVANVPDFVDLDEDLNFGSPTTLAYSGSNYAYTFDTANNESKTLYARVRNFADTSATVNDMIGLDTVTPEMPLPPTDAGALTNDANVTFNWTQPSDPALSSGIASYECQIGTAPNASDVFNDNVGNELGKTIAGPLGQTLYCRVRAIDRAGNASPWSAGSDGIFINTPPDAPQVSIDPPAPRTLDTITATAVATDPDGHSIINQRFEWRRSGQLQATGSMLAPGLTAKGEPWTVRAWAEDALGAESQAGEHSFTIQNSPPTQPIVEIRPQPAQPDQDLIVDVQVYSIDPDGDEIAYDFAWFKSTDGGAAWIHKVELDGSPQVSNLFISVGELWQVQFTPYEVESQPKPSGDGGSVPKGSRVEGAYGWDQAYIGENSPPTFQFESIRMSPGLSGVMLDVTWLAADADGESILYDIFWTDMFYSGLVPVAEGLTASDREFHGLTQIPTDRPVYLHATVIDAKGTVTHVTSGALNAGAAARSAWTIYR